MSVNASNLGLTHEQAASLMNSVVHQATGVDVLTQINTGDFTAVATTALRQGYDPIIGAISAVLGKTIVSINPYAAKLAAMRVTNERWGAMTRKINFIDRDVLDDERLAPMVEGQDYSPYVVRKPQVVETHWYGSDSYEDYVTIFRDQLDSAFTGVAQFSSFISGVIQNMLDKLEQYRENRARACLVNLIGSTIACETNNGANHRVVHLLTDYAAETGLSATPAWSDILADSKALISFTTWFYGTLKGIVRRMGERSALFHQNLAGPTTSDVKTIMRHTSPDRMRAYFLADYFDKLDAMANSLIYHDELLKKIPYEGVSYWQSIGSPAEISASVSYLKTVDSGAVYNDSAEDTVSEDMVFGVLFDEEAAMLVEKNEWTQATPMNARKGFYNQFYHSRFLMMNDNTENCVVFLLD